MKKYLILAAVAALAACENETLVETPQLPEEQEVAIGFGTGFNNMTRAENNVDATQLNGLENYHENFRVWGYKNIATDDATKFDRVAVFSGNEDKDYATAAQSIVTYNASAPAPFDTYKWVYDPVRYWDKSAANYDFHAAAPQKFGKDESGADINLAWKWTPKNVSTTDNTSDGKGEGNFSIAAQSVKGESLPLNKEVTIQVQGKNQDAFGQATNVKDCDLMIATDITNYSAFTQEPVHFLFNHILSRFNIGVRIGDGVYVDNATAPTRGVVLLKKVDIVKVYTQGDFDESLQRDEDILKNGTIERWPTDKLANLTTDAKPFGFPNEVVTGAEDGDTDNATLNLSKSFSAQSIAYTKADYKMVYQGLMIPQEAKYEDIKMDGSNIATAKYPYLYINYTIDGEEFKSYYNLAAVFNNLNAPYKDANNVLYAKTTVDNTYAYEKANVSGTFYSDATCNNAYTTIAYYDGEKYYDAAGTQIYFDNTDFYATYDATTGGYDNKLTDQPEVVILGKKDAVTYLTRKEALTLNPNELDIKFYEGWQNNLWITINPTAIIFDADVYQWADKLNNNHTIE